MSNGIEVRLVRQNLDGTGPFKIIVKYGNALMFSLVVPDIYAATIHTADGAWEAPHKFATTADAEEFIKRFFQYLESDIRNDSKPPRGPCGMSYHADDCDCGGVAGDR
jgi:hypothetical protein